MDAEKTWPRSLPALGPRSTHTRSPTATRHDTTHSRASASLWGLIPGDAEPFRPAPSPAGNSTRDRIGCSGLPVPCGHRIVLSGYRVRKHDRLTIPKGSASLWRLTGSPFTLRTRPSVAVSNTLCSSPEPEGGLKANFSPCGTRWRLPPSGDRRLRPAPYLWPRPVGGVVNLVGVTPERHSVRRRPVLY